MRFLKSLLPLSIINSIVLFCVTLTLPEIIPSHMNAKMEIDGYASRWIIMIMGTISIAISLGILIYWSCTKNNEKLLKNRKTEEILLPLITVLMILISWVPVYLATSYDNLNANNNASLLYSLIFFVIGAFMTIISNFMGIIKYNRWLGIRTPWTLRDESVWKKTHRLGGYTGVTGGIVICVSATFGFIFNSIALLISGFVIGMLFAVATPVIYSYKIYKKDANTKTK